MVWHVRIVVVEDVGAVERVVELLGAAASALAVRGPVHERPVAAEAVGRAREEEDEERAHLL